MNDIGSSKKRNGDAGKLSRASPEHRRAAQGEGERSESPDESTIVA